MSLKNENLAFDTITIEGGLFVPDLISKAAHGTEEFQKENDYNIPPGLKLQAEYGRAFQIAIGYYTEFEKNIKRKDIDKNSYSLSYLKSLLENVFFYKLQKQDYIEENGIKYPISFIDSFGTVIVLADPDYSLDTSTSKCAVISNGTSHKKSPFQMTQEYLNACRIEGKWGIVFNGKKIRLIRNSTSMTRPSWLEFDYEDSIKNSKYLNFVAMWRIIHATRGNKIEDSTIWEHWYKKGIEQGFRVKDRLRSSVTQALITLGTGFLAHPSNTDLRSKLQNQQINANDLFQQLLRMVYRLIFLFTTEERGILNTENQKGKELYNEGYSQRRLRKHCLRFSKFYGNESLSGEKYDDLWKGQKVVFKFLQDGSDLLALPSLGGIFGKDQCPDLDEANISNNCFMNVIKLLRYDNSSGKLSPIDYGNMGTEELGSVYESLLELIPSISLDYREFVLNKSSGNDRKKSGSYYTPDSLVQELIKSALEPIINKKLSENKENPVEALLSINIIDPACGSGHFLLAAARRLAERLASLNSEDGSVKPNEYRKALHRVISNCIYGVDSNPMAIELARTALWLEGYESDKPLSFLDNKLICGDSLLGVMNINQLKNGIPSEAYEALTGDDKDFCKKLKTQNTFLLKTTDNTNLFIPNKDYEKVFASINEINSMTENSTQEIELKRLKYAEFEANIDKSNIKKASDLFVGAWLAPKTKEIADVKAYIIPNTDNLRYELYNNYKALKNISKEDEDNHNKAVDYCQEICKKSRVLHWFLTFYTIMKNGGFDCVLGNPPWERIKLQEEEFFAPRNTLIANAQNKARRQELINLLRDGRLTTSPEADKMLYKSFEFEKHSAEAQSKYVHVESPFGRFPLTGKGDVNTFALFAETIKDLIAPDGRAGFIIPTNIATDNSTKDYFADITINKKLISLYDFENKEAIFQDVHRSYKIALITLGKAENAEFAFFASKTKQLRDSRRKFKLTEEDFALLNPNTKTSPVSRSQKDIELLESIYRCIPILWREEKKEINPQTGKEEVIQQESNPWNISFMRMFDMSNDSKLFINPQEFASDLLPLYEAKLIHHYDHRYGTYTPKEDGKKKSKSDLEVTDVTLAQKHDPGYEISPQYYIKEKYVLGRIARNIPQEFAKAFITDNYQELTKLLANWLYISQESIDTTFEYGKSFSEGNLFASSSKSEKLLDLLETLNCEDGKQLYEMVKDLNKTPKSKFADLKFQKKVEDNHLTTEEISNIFMSISIEEIAYQLMKLRSPKWLMGFRDITNVTNERTIIASVLPFTGVGNTLVLLLGIEQNRGHFAALFYANFISLVVDYCARQKLGGTHLNMFIAKQIPILPPDFYHNQDMLFIVPKVLELTYTSNSMRPWAEDVYNSAPEELKAEILRFCNVTIDSDGLFKPFTFNSERRAHLRAELDAYYAKLYGLTRDELRYILDPADVMGPDYPSETFRVLKDSEIAKYGTYRTRDLVLAAYDNLCK